MRSPLPIPATLQVVIQCWNEAEVELRGNIEKKYYDLDEEFITKLFYCELSFALRKASAEKRISQAFLADLRKAFPRLSHKTELVAISDNLVADVSLHSRQVEKVTGGDFGFTITRPQVSIRTLSGHTRFVIVTEEYQRGLLCQAKLHRRDGKWGKLTQRQRNVFPERMNYLGLVLYRYSDDERRKLNEFSWQLCRDETLTNVENWLKSDQFPSATNSATIISKLGNAQIGTDDLVVLEKFIRPKGRPYITIMITWLDDKRPPKTIPVLLPNINEGVRQRQQIYNRLSQ